MKYMRKTAGYTGTDYKTNTEITKELNITTVFDEIQECRRNWLQRLNRMPHSRSPRMLKKLWMKRQKKPGETVKGTSRCVRPNGSTSGKTACWLHDDDDDDDIQLWTHCIVVLTQEDQRQELEESKCHLLSYEAR